MDKYVDLLNQRKNELKQYRYEAAKRLEKLKYKGTPECRIRISAKKNQIYLIQKDAKKKERYLKGDQRVYAEQIATFEYLNEVIARIDKEIKWLDQFLEKYSSPEDYYESLSKGRQRLIIPVKLTDEQFVEAWMSKPYTGGTFAEGDAEYYTDRNERVRSKSEILIANALAKYNVPYKYECPIVLKGLGKIYPDFTALNVKRRKVYYWEHLGMMDDEDYASKSVIRLNTYEKNGFTQGDSLLFTMETGKTPLDVKLVDNMINCFLLN